MSEEFKQLIANLKDFLSCADLEYRERDAIQSIEYQIIEYVEAVEAAGVKDGITAIAWYQRAKELEAENKRLRDELSVWREDYALLQAELQGLRDDLQDKAEDKWFDD